MAAARDRRAGFSGRVLELARMIPRGRVSTYSGIASLLGRPGAARAVGSALRRNSRPVDIPCHRVVRSDGSVGGYSGMHGTAGKERLLREEGVEVSEGKVDLAMFGWLCRAQKG